MHDEFVESALAAHGGLVEVVVGSFCFDAATHTHVGLMVVTSEALVRAEAFLVHVTLTTHDAPVRFAERTHRCLVPLVVIACSMLTPMTNKV
jgi:hypothetical protein